MAVLKNNEVGASPNTPLEQRRPADAPPPAIDVRALVGEGREVVILHKGESYRLRITANDKLILTK